METESRLTRGALCKGNKSRIAGANSARHHETHPGLLQQTYSTSPRPARKPSGRKRGAQPGHKRHERKLLPVEEVDDVVDHHPAECPECHTNCRMTCPLWQSQLANRSGIYHQ